MLQSIQCILRARPLVAVQVNGYADFCTEKDDPHDAQTDRHRAKTASKGHASVPVATSADGTETAAFERKHALGVVGIVMTFGLTQTRRMVDHWGTSEWDNFALVRKCMPRDFFLLFYSRFLHFASATPVSKDDEGYDSKHHIRYHFDLQG